MYGVNPLIKVKSKGKPTQTVTLQSNGLSALEMHNIHPADIIVMMQNQCHNTALTWIHKHISQILFAGEPEVLSSIKDIHNLLKNKKGKPLAIITNLAVGAEIQDLPFYQTQMFNQDNCGEVLSARLAGQYHDVDHFIDPFMKWGDNRIILLFNNFYNFNIIPDTIKNQTLSVNHKIYIKQNKPKYKLYSIPHPHSIEDRLSYYDIIKEDIINAHEKI